MTNLWPPSVRQLNPQLIRYLYTVCIYIHTDTVHIHRCVSGSEQLWWLNSRCDASFRLVNWSCGLLHIFLLIQTSYFLPNISFSTFVPFDIKCRFITKSSVPCCNCRDCRLQSHLKHQTSYITCLFFTFILLHVLLHCKTPQCQWSTSRILLDLTQSQ